MPLEPLKAVTGSNGTAQVAQVQNQNQDALNTVKSQIGWTSHFCLSFLDVLGCSKNHFFREVSSTFLLLILISIAESFVKTLNETRVKIANEKNDTTDDDLPSKRYALFIVDFLRYSREVRSIVHKRLLSKQYSATGKGWLANSNTLICVGMGIKFTQKWGSRGT